MPSVRSASDGLRALEAWRTVAPRWREGSHFCLACFQYLLRDGEAADTSRSHNKVHPEMPYPCSGGASSTDGGRVELCVQRISRDPIGFHVRSCGFRSGPSDLRVSCLVMFVALVRWSFVALPSRLLVSLLWPALPDLDDGGAMTMARFGSYQCQQSSLGGPSTYFINFWGICTTTDDYQ